MHKDSLQSLIALRLTYGVGPVALQHLLAYCPNPQNIYKLSKSRLMRIPEIGEKTASAILQKNHFKTAESEINWCEEKGIRIISYLDAEYPAWLKEIPDLPILIFVKGNMRINSVPWIAVVGTRTPDIYGKKMAEEFTRQLISSGVGILSGLALGIDAEAHKSALQNKGITAAVLGHGLDRIYPWRHAKLAEQICDSGGCLITEYLSGTPPDAVNFPSRNRIVAGICKAVLVIQAAQTGGALITARLAFDYNREVFAIPGQIGQKYSEGCNHIITKQIAQLVQTPSDILEQLGWKENTPPLPLPKIQKAEIPLHPDEKKLILLLEEGDISIDTLSEKSGFPISQLQSRLLSMEIRELIRFLPGKKISIKNN